MGVLYSHDRAGPWTPQSLDCLYFGDSVDPEPPAAFWFGAAGDLLLHPVCATKLGTYLVADSREAELAAGGEPRWAQRAA
jgi:hypothetical protein